MHDLLLDLVLDLNVYASSSDTPIPLAVVLAVRTAYATA